MTYINTYIIFDNSFEVSPRQFVQSKSQGVATFLDYTNEFFFQKRNPFHNFFTRNFF